MKGDLTHARLLELVTYDPDTGRFYSRSKRARWPAGRLLGSLEPSGYHKLYLDGVSYYTHRVAWFYVKGAWPAPGFEIDHINRDRSDNRFVNLREVTRAVNHRNKRNAKLPPVVRYALLTGRADAAFQIFSRWWEGSE